MVVGSLHPYILRMVSNLCSVLARSAAMDRRSYWRVWVVPRSCFVRSRSVLTSYLTVLPLADCPPACIRPQGVEPRWKGLNTAIPVAMVSKRTYRWVSFSTVFAVYAPCREMNSAVCADNSSHCHLSCALSVYF